MPVTGGPKLHLGSPFNGSTSDAPLPHSANEASSNSTAGAGGSPTVTGVVIHDPNVTAISQPSTTVEDDGSDVPGGIIAFILCLVVIVVIVVGILCYLRRTGQLYRMIPFKRLANGPRRSSCSGSDRTLHMKNAVPDDDDDDDYDANNYRDDGEQNQRRPPESARRHHPPPHLNNNRSNSGGGGGGGREGGKPEDSTMFTIEDHDMDSVDIGDGNFQGTPNDEYFYDEAFGKPMFEDEATNASMRQLYLDSENADEEEEMMDVDAIVESILGNKPKTASA